jgi:cytoskeletal protein CcmA (bactofilin family)
VVHHGNVIGAGIRVEGSVHGADSLAIEGAVAGSIELDGALLISAGAEIDASVSATTVHVDGLVRGTLEGSDRITVGPSAEIEGELKAPEITIDPQARVRGTFDMPLDLPRGLGSKTKSAAWR